MRIILTVEAVKKPKRHLRVRAKYQFNAGDAPDFCNATKDLYDLIVDGLEESTEGVEFIKEGRSE